MRIIAFTSLALVMAFTAYADVKDPTSDPMHTEPEQIDTPAPAGPEDSPGEPAGGPTSTSDTHNVDETEPDTNPSASGNSASQGSAPNGPAANDFNSSDEMNEENAGDNYEDLVLLLVPGNDHNYSPDIEAFTLGDLGVAE